MPNRSEGRDISRALTLLMAVATGAMVANLYYAQTLLDMIGPDLSISPELAGSLVTIAQLGYGVGLALIVPLSDRFENRRLILITCAGTVIGSIGTALSGNAITFLTATLLTGICATGAQILIPLATHLSRPERTGSTIGLVMSGLLTGIMLARPAASFMAEWLGWRAIFYFSAIVMTAILLCLWKVLPERRPESRHGFGEILISMARLVRDEPQLRLRATYQMLLFTAFNLFWTVAPLALLRQFHLSQDDVAWFALAGAGGALAAPLAGSLADKGKERMVTLAAFLLLAVSFLIADAMVALGSVVLFAITAFTLDASVQLNQITGQRIIFSLSKEARGRINASYMTIMFVIGASGSLIGSASYETGGFRLSSMIGAGLGVAALIVMLLFDRRSVSRR
ncbi:MFS transporter [Stakelama sediminis]|uniref:Putative MFS family arabinose efflux permease n=1 Tax=Stakelama sediminis TaxID=463200 RepID=A0A840YZ32_9SPHN|nr:MFS transporter [Stakelama sediminis]MBB5718766.1 putative MFS family arabinose efflux permease [Stakelama sediminis]